MKLWHKAAILGAATACAPHMPVKHVESLPGPERGAESPPGGKNWAGADASANTTVETTTTTTATVEVAQTGEVYVVEVSEPVTDAEWWEAEEGWTGAMPDEASTPTADDEYASECWAIPAYVVARESGCQNVPNEQGSGCDGYYQICAATWDGYGGYDDALSAPKEVQDAKAAELWDGGNGCRHWDAC